MKWRRGSVQIKERRKDIQGMSGMGVGKMETGHSSGELDNSLSS